MNTGSVRRAAYTITLQNWRRQIINLFMPKEINSEGLQLQYYSTTPHIVENAAWEGSDTNKDEKFRIFARWGWTSWEWLGTAGVAESKFDKQKSPEIAMK